mgnify:CR=1 FL=1
MKISYRKLAIACANSALNITAAISKANCSINVLHRIKNGKNVNTATVGKLAAALGVTVESLLADEQ